MSNKTVKALEARLKMRERELDTVKAELRSLKAERDRSPLTVPGPLSTPLRSLAAELGFLEEWASPIPGRPESGGRSADPPLPHEPHARSVARRDEAGELVVLVVEKLRSDRDGTGVHIPWLCPLCSRLAPRPRRHDDVSGSEEPPDHIKSLILDRCLISATKGVISRFLSAELSSSIDGRQLDRWLRHLTTAGVISAQSEADVIVYHREVADE